MRVTPRSEVMRRSSPAHWRAVAYRSSRGRIKRSDTRPAITPEATNPRGTIQFVRGCNSLLRATPNRVSSTEERHLPELYQLPRQAKLGAEGVLSGRPPFAPRAVGWRGTMVGPRRIARNPFWLNPKDPWRRLPSGGNRRKQGKNVLGGARSYNSGGVLA